MRVKYPEITTSKYLRYMVEEHDLHIIIVLPSGAFWGAIYCCEDGIVYDSNGKKSQYILAYDYTYPEGESVRYICIR